MKKNYTIPRTIRVQLGGRLSLMTTSMVEVKGEDYDSNTMTDLSRSGNGYWDDEE